MIALVPEQVGQAGGVGVLHATADAAVEAAGGALILRLVAAQGLGLALALLLALLLLGGLLLAVVVLLEEVDDGLAESERDNRGPKGSKEGEIIAEKLDTQDDDESSLEDFEVNASQYVSQTELQRVYLLPKGTIDVMSFIERDNPHKRGWNKMKLYSRSDARRRARKRFGGKDGLIAERENRKRKKFENELKEVRKMS